MKKMKMKNKFSQSSKKAIIRNRYLAFVKSLRAFNEEKCLREEKSRRIIINMK